MSEPTPAMPPNMFVARFDKIAVVAAPGKLLDLQIDTDQGGRIGLMLDTASAVMLAKSLEAGVVRAMSAGPPEPVPAQRTVPTPGKPAARKRARADA